MTFWILQARRLPHVLTVYRRMMFRVVVENAASQCDRDRSSCWDHQSCVPEITKLDRKGEATSKRLGRWVSICSRYQKLLIRGPISLQFVQFRFACEKEKSYRVGTYGQVPGE